MARLGAALAALVLLAAAGCSEADLLTAPTSSARLDGTWHLASLQTSAVSHTEPASERRFTLTFADDRLLVKADCNTCAASTTLDGDVLTVSLLACTKAICTTTPLDTVFTTSLETSHTVRLDASRLQLASTRGELRFER
ncbi:MAG: META domain-containing protein [Vicinamibacterales bacterium]